MTEPTREEIFAFIESKGGDSVVVSYSGGNDEGGIDSIEMFKDELKVCEFEEPREEWNAIQHTYVPDDSNPDNKFIAAMTAPVYEEYHSFAGEYSVEGAITWDCKERKVTDSGDIEVPSYDSYEKEI
jgi:hypothetical protein